MTIAESGAVPPVAPSGYDSGAAAFHVFSHASRHGWGALIGLGLLYLAYYVVIGGLSLWAIWPLFSTLAEYSGYTEADFNGADGAVFLSAMSRFFVFVPVMVILHFVIWAMIEAALLRWLYGRGARLRFGGVELGLIVLCFLWAFLPVAVFAAPFILAILAGIVGSGSAALGALVGLICALAFIAAFFVWIVLAVRFAPAAALTVRDGRIHVFSAWDVSRGRFWPVLGGFVIAIVVYIGVSMVLSTISQIGFMAAGFNAMSMYMTDFGQVGGEFGEFGPEPDFGAMIELFTSPVMIALMVISGILSAIASFVFQAMLAGVNAYGVKQMDAPRLAV